MFNEIKRVIEQVSRDKGIDSGVLIKTIEEAIASAARKKLGPHAEIEVNYKPVTGEIEVFQFKEVVQRVTDPATQIIFEEGRELDPECEPGDSLGIKLDTAFFGRIAAQSAKQVIIQKMKDAEKNAVYEGFINRKGEVINGIVQRIDRGDIIVNLGQTEALLPAREQIPREVYRRGDRIRANIMKVLHDARGPQVVLTRTHPGFLINLFKAEVPEINEGIVLIQAAAREPGSRGKIAVSSVETGIDPVGACVGVKGNRVQNVVQELRGEKIDIVPWDLDPARFVCNSLAPAKISRVIIDEENRSMEVIVPGDSLSIAIGKKGQNVRLASKLTGWRLDVTSEEKYSKALKDGYDALMILPSVGMALAEKLYEHGLVSPEVIKDASVDDLMAIAGMTQEDAENIMKEAAAFENSEPEVHDTYMETGVSDIDMESEAPDIDDEA